MTACSTLMCLFGILVTVSYLMQVESNNTLDQLFDKFWKILVLGRADVPARSIPGTGCTRRRW